MDFKKIIENEKLQIANTLKAKGWANAAIDYEEFLKLYSNYKKNMSEEEFAYAIGLNYNKLKFMRTRGTKSVILKQKASEQLENEIIDKLTLNGYTNKKINYNELVQLYYPYRKTITEKEFGKIIGVNDRCYKNIKSNNGYTTILKREIDIEKIQREVYEEYGEIRISYEEFLNIYEKYKPEINDEIKFAEIIRIGYKNFQKMKHKGIRTRIFKEKPIPKQLRDKILNETNIEETNYIQFIELYKKYANEVSELQFALLLGIRENTLRDMKKNSSKTICLKKNKKIPIKREEEIKQELIIKGYANKKISYEEFLHIYSDYKEEMKEKKFAEILGVSESNYDSMKFKNKKVIILKTEIIENEIIYKINNDERIVNVKDKYIDYDSFLKLYEPYMMFMTQTQFAEIIGIKYTDFNSTFKKSHAKVDSILGQRRRVKYLTKESRIYDLEEINDICNKYNISLDLFFCIITNSTKNRLIEDYKNALFQKKEIYIGNKCIDTIFIQKYGDEIINYINVLSRYWGKLLGANEYADDVASDTILYITQNRGDFFINFDEDVAIQKIKKFIKKEIEHNYQIYFDKRHELIIDEKYNETDRDESRKRKMTDKDTDTEKKAIEITSKSDIRKQNQVDDDIYTQCIQLLQYYYELGFSNTEAINKVAEDINLDKNTMLELLKKALIEKNRIRQTSRGEYYLE